MTEARETPRIWIGCLACYNAGRLVGDWYDATEGDTVTPEDIHGQATTHEELWVMDHEYLPVTGELSPMSAAKIARGMAEVPDYIPAEAVRAYVDNIGTSYVDWDTIGDDVQEAYAGEWDSLEDYAEELAQDIGAITGEESWPLSYIDWERAARDLVLGGDIWTHEAGGSVYVFRNI